MRKQVILKSLVVGIVVLAVNGALGALPALGAELHAFNPRLSLTGGCETSLLDEIPDPSCPYQAPPNGPTEHFIKPTGIAVDAYGDLYVASEGEPEGTDGHIDVFNAEGHFITEVAEPQGPRSIAVDSKGYLYVYSFRPGSNAELRRFEPLVYEPANGEIEYEPAPAVVVENGPSQAALAVNSANDHLFVNYGGAGGGLGALVEYGTGEAGNPLINSAVGEPPPTGKEGFGSGLAIDASHGRIYDSDREGANVPYVVRVFELAPPHNRLETFTGSSVPPSGNFLNDTISLAVDEATGHLFVYATGEAENRIWELSETGQYLTTIEHGLASRGAGLAVDNGAESPNGALNEGGRFLWATSASSLAEGHAFAFGPPREAKPAIESVSFAEVGEAEAELRAEIETGQLETTYSFEYVRRSQFLKTGFAEALLAGEGTIPAGEVPVTVTAEASGLSPGIRYVFRVIATNELGSDEGQAGFRTYPTVSFGPCPNDAVRTGFSASLPDCRAYELVTPGDTNARAPMGSGYNGAYFPSVPAAPDGSSVSFRIEGGLIPGSEGTGSLAGDPYLATHGSGGWSTVGTGGRGTEATAVLPGSRSPDQGYSVWTASGKGPGRIDGEDTTYLRFPDGHSEVLGRGDLGIDPLAAPKLISQGGSHVIFLSSAHLESNAPAPGKLAVYDRADGVTHVASLLPGNIPPSSGASYQGASIDGLGIAFSLGNKLYLRVNGETFEVGEGVTFEGVAEGGKRIFYLEGGNLYAFEAGVGKIPFATTGDAVVVNVAADGTAAYFVSHEALSVGPNPMGVEPEHGRENLYLSREGTISYVGPLTALDVKGEGSEKDGGVKFNGLGLWSLAFGGAAGRRAVDPSRSTSDGGVLLFQSRAPLTGYDPEGSIEVYRYDRAEKELTCVSCNPTESPASGGALLQSVGQNIESVAPNDPYDLVENLSADGRRALFQTTEPLVAADTNKRQDVYEWEAQGTGSCAQAHGCLYLLSSGRSAKDNYLYAASDSGNDVFIWTGDLLLPADVDETPSLYDARVEGGFPESSGGECEGEGCRPLLSAPPALPTPGMSPAGESGNVRPHCPKGTHRVKRKGKVRCAKPHHKHHGAKKRSHRKAKKGAGK